MHIQRKPEEQLGVDWAGDQAHIIDPVNSPSCNHNRLWLLHLLAFFAELLDPNRNNRFGYAVFFGKSFEGCSLSKMKADNLLLEFRLIVSTHL